MHLRNAVVTVLFGVTSALIANLAWATAVGTSGPWFSPTVSLQVYTITLLSATIVALGLSTVTAGRVAYLDELLHEWEVRIAAVQGGAKPWGKSAVTEAHAKERATDGGFDEVFDETPRAESGTVVGLERIGQGSIVGVPDVVEATGAGAKAEALQDLVEQRHALQAARARAWFVVAGPIILSIVFVAIAGPMLPGSERFAEQNFRLNTTLILFLGYGWAVLVAWSVAALAMLYRPTAASGVPLFGP